MASRMCLPAADYGVLCAMSSSGFWIAAWRRLARTSIVKWPRTRSPRRTKQPPWAELTSVVDRDEAGRVCDLVIEAATEKFEIKAEIFRDLDRSLPAGGDSGVEYFFDFDYQDWAR